jgi:hypothetical protein
MGPWDKVPPIHEGMGMAMMAAASAPGLDAENRMLKAEMGILQEENASLKARLDKIEVWQKWLEGSLDGITTGINKTNKRLSVLEKSPSTKKHIDFLETWLKEHRLTRKGLTYAEAAEKLNVDEDYISQMKDAINLDGRLVVEKKPTGKRRMQIRLA